MKLKRGILYISLHNQLIRMFGVNRIVEKKAIEEKLGRHFLVPKSIRAITIIELEEKGLIKIESSNQIRILPCDLDLKEDANKIYELAGLFDTKK